MLEQATDVVLGCLADLCVAPLIPKQVCSTVPQALMRVHTGAVVAEDGFGHKGSRLGVRSGYVPNDVFVIHHIVGHLRKRRVLHVDLALASSANLVVMDLDRNAHSHQLQDDLRSDVLKRVGGRHREIAFLVAQLVTQIGIFLAARVPGPLVRIYVVVAGLCRPVVADVVEDVEL